MKRVSLQCALLLSAVELGVGLSGCRDEASPAASAQAQLDEKTGPEESFELIVQTFRRGVEDVPLGFVVRREDGHSLLTGKNEVTHELIPPAKEGDPYQAIITVNSQSSYSIRQSTDPPDETETEQEGVKASGLNDLDETDSDIEILDSDLVSGSSSSSQKLRTLPRAATTAVNRRPDGEVRKYELVYENGRWTLVTKLDPETEQSIENAFEKALSTQI